MALKPRSGVDAVTFTRLSLLSESFIVEGVENHSGGLWLGKKRISGDEQSHLRLGEAGGNCLAKASRQGRVHSRINPSESG
jgi:hypothetical protein